MERIGSLIPTSAPTPTRRQAIVGRPRRVHPTWLLPPLFLALLFLLWEGLVRWQNYPAYILPTPGRIWTRFLSVLSSGALWWHARLTLSEILLGLVLGVGVAIALGYVLAKSHTLEGLLAPYIVASQAIPAVAVAPLIIIWFGLGGFSKILICALTLFFPVLVNTVVGLRSIDRDLAALMASLGASRWQRFTKLEVPAALPVLLGGLKIGVILAVIGAVVGEFVGSDRGIGFLINVARGSYDTPLLFVALFTLVAISLTLYSIVGWLESRWLAWRE